MTLLTGIAMGISILASVLIVTVMLLAVLATVKVKFRKWRTR